MDHLYQGKQPSAQLVANNSPLDPNLWFTDVGATNYITSASELANIYLPSGHQGDDTITVGQDYRKDTLTKDQVGPSFQPGPFKINGVSLRHVNQSYVIETSTKADDISGVNVEKFDDKYFAKEL
ncbi:hypothetical protein F0562_015873 [Nyssa sinensis]|uniref:Uncharacterized protein n=1 Tax=Nyssa sinensis TaxID=561372 RepID=A0A5J4ZKA5_9ASTE|nr:hypothetical protein F0562_015873 [Nyssa sinensis]